MRWLAILILLCPFAYGADATITHGTGSQGSITHYGITWTFDKNLQSEAGDGTHYQAGRYVTGDAWVVGPVEITDFYPHSFTGNGVLTQDGDTWVVPSGRTINGSEVNPDNPEKCGFDSIWTYFWQSSKNVAFGIGGETHLTVANGSSVVSCISNQNHPYIKLYAILNVVASAPAEGDFRPPYFGTTKTVYNESSIDYDVLADLTTVASAPAKSVYEGYFEMPWVDHFNPTPGMTYQAKDTMHCAATNPYGGDMAKAIGEAILLLNVNDTDANKRLLTIRMCQYGIDLYAVSSQKVNTYYGVAGLTVGRKIPILFAGYVLNNATLKGIGAKSGDYLLDGGTWPSSHPADYIHYSEDDQTHYVTQTDVDLTNGPTWSPDPRDAVKTPYVSGDIGMPEWGIQHAGAPQSNNKYFETYYRVVAGCSFPAQALSALVMGMQTTWNHDVFFEYTDRYMDLIAIGGEQAEWHGPSYAINVPSAFTWDMWDTYRDNYGDEPASPVLDAIGSKSVTEGSNLAFTLTATSGTPPYVYSATYQGGALPANATLTDDDFSWTPGSTQSGVYNITFTVTDDNAKTDSEVVQITVNDYSAPIPPVLATIGNQSGTVGVAYSKTCSATDATTPADTLTWSSEGLPTWASLNTSTGAITGTPTHPGRWRIKITVSDGSDTDYEIFFLEVRTGGPVYSLF